MNFKNGKVYVSYADRLKLCKESMDSGEGNIYWKKPDEREFPPLYESVNGKDTEHKSRLCPAIDRALVPFKAYYFFFFGAIGSLFPFISLYYRHLWLTPAQAGLLVGLRPIVQSLAVPVWAAIADKCQVKKLVLLIGLCGWLLTHTSILLVPPGQKPSSCSENTTAQQMRKRSVGNAYPAPHDNHGNPGLQYDSGFVDSTKLRQFGNDFQDASLIERRSMSSEESDIVSSQNSFHQDGNVSSTNGISIGSSGSPHHTSKTPEVENELMKTENDGMWTFGKTRLPIKTWHTFAYLCIIIMVGNLFSAPAQTMANTATLHRLEADTHKYGQQRCFGSIGWGCAAFVVGMLVSMNHDSALACKDLDDINYTPCFYAFGILMLFALAIALLFKYGSENKAENVQVALLKSLREELDRLTCFILFSALLAGFNMGFIQTFLFWHLQTLGGTQKLFSIITGFNAVGEMIGFLLSVKLIEKFGHLNVLALGIAAYAVRLFVYALVQDPWYVLTVELLKAFTSSAVWASVLSFIGVTNGSAATLQSLLHMLYWGVGYGGGGAIGGILMDSVGARTVFLGLAFTSVIDMFAILMALNLNCCPRRKQDIYMPVNSDEEEESDSETMR